mgnify:CR=1 FL=1|jgi:hypothetical protein
MKKITILTRPVGIQLLIHKTKNILFFLKSKLSGKQFVFPRSDGHPAVTKGLLAGLKSLKVNFNYNPLFARNIGNTVVVLSGIDALHQIIKLKRNCKIKTLIAGPNVIVHAYDFNNLMSSPEINLVLVPSENVADIYCAENPKLKNRIAPWFAGVNENNWKPDETPVQTIRDNFLRNAQEIPHGERDKETIPTSKENNILIYKKSSSEKLYESVIDTVKRYGWNPITISYHTYTKKEFKQKLEQCSFAIFLSKSESQGIALAESWAMDVPTLVWNPQDVLFTKNNHTYKNNACPYLTNETGITWKNISELEKILKNIQTDKYAFKPRLWVLKHMTDVISAQTLLNLI